MNLHQNLTNETCANFLSMWQGYDTSSNFYFVILFFVATIVQ